MITQSCFIPASMKEEVSLDPMLNFDWIDYFLSHFSEKESNDLAIYILFCKFKEVPTLTCLAILYCFLAELQGKA